MSGTFTCLAEQRRILSIDGGGLRGLVALGVLAEIEALLRRETGNPALRLADYFDFIAGTSTGAIVAAGLSLGLSVAEISDFYRESGRLIFHKTRLSNRFRYKYDADGLRDKLREVFGKDTTLGSDRLRTLLLLVMRNGSTDSPWLVSNNPRAMFNDRALADCNLDLPLWQLVRASAAAPVFFEAEEIQVGPRRFVFMDGATTPYNNPAFQAFLMATVDRYGLNWSATAESMLLVSVGTGGMITAAADRAARDMTLLYAASTVPQALIAAATVEQDRLCRIFGDCRAGDPIDLEVGDLIGASGPIDRKLFTYLRYNTDLDVQSFARLGCDHLRPERLTLDAVEAMPEMLELGRFLGHRVCREHFKGFIPVAGGCSAVPPAAALQAQ